MARKGTAQMILGALLILAAAGLTCWNIAQASRAENASAGVAQKLSALQEEAQPPLQTESGNTDTDPAWLPGMEMPVTTVDGREYLGMLRIAQLELELPVAAQWSYPVLKEVPCRYKGSAYDADLILMAHNYESHFGRIRQLRPGDAVTFEDAAGNLFSYQVADLEELPGTAVEAMEAGQWDLTLFTCTYGGRSRIAVRCLAAE